MAHRHLVVALALGAFGCSDGTGTSEPTFAIDALAPNRVSPNTGFLLTVLGRGIGDSAVIELNGDSVESTVFNSGQVYAIIPASALPEEGTGTVAVVNPDGERSNLLRLPVVDGAVPFRVDSISPVFTSEVAPDAPLVAYFSEPLDSASIADTSLTVRRDDGTVTSGATYDPDRHALILAGALSPAARFTARISLDLRAEAGGALERVPEWIFTTSFAPTVVLSASANWPAVVIGLDGRPRVAYMEREDNAGSHLALSTCVGDCGLATGWSHAVISASGAFGNYAALALGPGGRLHFAHQEGFDGLAIYAPGAGQSVILASDAAYTSIAAAPSGRVHLLYYAIGDLYHATCTGACTDAASWVTGTVDTVGNVGSFSSVATDSDGGVHVTYFENDAGDLRYAFCPAPCSTPTWTSGSVDTVGRTGIGSSLLVDGSARIHAAWLDQDTGEVMYGTCTVNCTTMAQWTTTPVEAVGHTDFGLYHTGLAVGPTGALELSYTAVDGRVRHATCTGGCAESGASWTPFTVSLHSGVELANWVTQLAVDGQGKRHLVWIDRDDALRYMRY